MFERATGFAHELVQGFTDRQGGVSQGEFASLNLGAKWGDEPERVAENLKRLGKAAGFDPLALVRVKQVHGAQVVRALEAQPTTEADAVWAARDDRLVCGVMTADCVPVLIADGGNVCAAVHAGWRGTVAGIVAETVRTLTGAGARLDRLHAAIGPCIELRAFEVGEEVAVHFDAIASSLGEVIRDPLVMREGVKKPHVDLVATVRAQLEFAGVRGDAIERVGGCTHDQPDRYFSYRRDGKGTGQQLSFIGWR